MENQAGSDVAGPNSAKSAARCGLSAQLTSHISTKQLHLPTPRPSNSPTACTFGMPAIWVPQAQANQVSLAAFRALGS